MMDTFPIALGCDCDPDRLGFSPMASNTHLTWQGIEEGIPAFCEARRRFHQDTGIWPRMTWFVRADYQVEREHGHAGYCLERFNQLWRRLEEEGDEIAWHPHLWDWDDRLGRWFQSVGDSHFTRRCLTTGYEAFQSVWGGPPQTVHAGWCYQDDLTLAFMAEKGLLADCSAVPEHNTQGHGLVDQADWSRSPASPYWPSNTDYQRPAHSADEALGLLQIPASVGNGLLARTLKIFRDQLKRRSLKIRYDGFRSQVPLMSLPGWLNGPLLDDAVQRALQNGSGYFFSYTHCDEFLPQRDKTGLPRLMYGLDHIFPNVQRVHERLCKLSLQPEYQTIAVLANSLRERFPVASGSS